MSYSERKKGIVVRVDGDHIEKALRKLKKKVQTADLFRDLERHESYTKPTTERKQKRAAAKARWQRYLESQSLPPKNY